MDDSGLAALRALTERADAALHSGNPLDPVLSRWRYETHPRAVLALLDELAARSSRVAELEERVTRAESRCTELEVQHGRGEVSGPDRWPARTDLALVAVDVAAAGDAWDPRARLVGNVRADELASLARSYIEALRKIGEFEELCQEQDALEDKLMAGAEELAAEHGKRVAERDQAQAKLAAAETIVTRVRWLLGLWRKRLRGEIAMLPFGLREAYGELEAALKRDQATKAEGGEG